MEQDLQAERLYRVANACKDMTGALRQMSQDLARMHLPESDELVAHYKRATEGILSLERAALERMVAEFPGHLMADLAPREIEAIAKRRRELLGALTGKRPV